MLGSVLDLAPCVAFAVDIFPAKIKLWEMRLSLGKWNRRTLIASIMLVAFASRGLIPPGFMPASGRPFSIEICWEGLPSDTLAHGEQSHRDSMDMESMDMEPMPADSMAPDSGNSTSRHDPLHGEHNRSGSPSHGDHCVFGTACSAGPIPHRPLPSIFTTSRQLRAVAFASMAVDVRIVHLPQPRAPPVQLS